MKKKDKVVRYDVDTDKISMKSDTFLDIVEKSAAKLREYVWVVVDFGVSEEDTARIVGVYAKKDDATTKKNRTKCPGAHAVLKFRIKGQ